MKKNQPYILYVGNAHPHKNVESLIKAMDYLPNFRLVLAGNDLFFYPRLPKHPQVVCLGHIPNDKIADLYKDAQIFVSASQMEGFGIPPLEAMSVGCPVILSDIPVFHEINGDAAVYFDQNDPQDIAKVISETLADKELTKEMIRRGYKQAAKYSWEKCVGQTYKAYESCLSL